MFELVIPAFFAGLLTFLAPCTLPLVPGYLGFISGVSLEDLKDPEKARGVRRKVFFNGVFYVIGFSVVFMALGSLVGLGGSLLGQYRDLLSKIGGVFVIIFGLFMMQMAAAYYKDRWPWLRYVKIPLLDKLQSERRISLGSSVKPGTPLSSVIFGSAFAVGWTPCVGPILGAILTLAATEATVSQGIVLLGVFSLGLAVPFLILAAGIGYFVQRMQVINKILPAVSAVGGVFLIFLGVLVFNNSLGLWVAFFFRITGFANYEQILNFL